MGLFSGLASGFGMFGDIGGDLLGGLMGTDDAAEAAEQGQREAIAAEERMFGKSLKFQREMWDWQKGQAAPWRQAGLAAMGEYQRSLRPGGFDVTQDPGTMAYLDEGLKAIGRTGAARGSALSGRTLGAMREFSSGAVRSAFQNKLSNLAALISQGSGVSTNLGMIGGQFASGVGGQMIQHGQSIGQGYANIGSIHAQAATAPFQNIMSLGQVGAGLMTGYGAMGN